MDNTNKINNRSFFLGLGGSDAKSNVATLSVLNGLLDTFGDFYQTGDIVWVVAQKAFYIIDKETTPQYSVFTTGGDVESSDVTIYYGKQDDVLGFLQGDQSKIPSSLGYKHGDGIISSRAVTSGSVTIAKFDVYEANIPETPTALNPESYLFIGSMQGADGSDGNDGNDGNTGPQGDKGDKGDAFVVDAQGSLADRDIDCDTRPVGFAYLATDTGELYFKESDIGITPCTWSDGIPFGKGEPGETTYTVFKRALESTPPAAPVTGTLHPATEYGWSDAPPTTANPDFRLWISKTRYSSSTPSGNIIWSSPIMVDGEKGLDGTEGADGKGSGFWVIWTDSKTPDFINIPKPIIDGDGDYSIDLSGVDDWYDDVSIDNTPVWMGQIVLNSNTNTWADWQFSKIAGENPPYVIDVYKRAATQPAVPAGALEYINSATGTFTTGAEAAVIVGDGWADIPTAAGESLWVSKISLTYDGSNDAWSSPVKIDGDEGRQAGIWMIWSDKPITDRPTTPTDCNIIDQGTSIDLSNDPEWKDDVSDLTGDAAWSATSYYRPITSTTSAWTPWNIAQIKGADGLDAQEQKVYIPFRIAGQTFPPLYIPQHKSFLSITDALSYVDALNNHLNVYLDIWHDGGIGTSTPPLTVGNIIYEDSEGATPMEAGTELYYILTASNSTSGFNEAINYAKVNQSGYVTAIYSPEEARAILPAVIINAVDIDVPDFYNESNDFSIATPFPPKFVQVFLYCKTLWDVGTRTYRTGTWIPIATQNNSSDENCRGVQVSWNDNSPNNTTFNVHNSAFKVYGPSAVSGTDGHWVTTADYPYVKLVVRVFY